MNGNILLVPVIGLIWGLNWPIGKIALDQVPPWAVRTTALVLAGAVLMLAAVASGRSLRVRREHWWRLFAAGGLSLSAYNVLVAFAQLSASTARVAVLAYTMPIWATVLARVFLGEVIDRRKAAGLALGLAGLAALMWPVIAAGRLELGLLFALGGGLAWAGGTIVFKRYPIDAPGVTIAAWQNLIGVVIVGCGMLMFEGPPELRGLAGQTYAAITYQGVMSLALATVMWLTVLARIPASVAALGTLMVPAVGMLGAVVMLGERPTITDWTGLALILAASGAVLAPRAGPARAAEPAE